MPARNGTGPSGLGSRTRRGMGNCTSTKVGDTQSSIQVNNQLFGWGSRVLGLMVGRLFGRRRANRINRK